MDASEVCDVAECAKKIKQRLTFNDINNNESDYTQENTPNEASIHAVNPEMCLQSVDSIMSAIATQFKTKHSQFSMDDMRILLHCYEENYFIYDFIQNKENERKYTIKEGGSDLEEESPSESLNTITKGKTSNVGSQSTLKESAFEHGWIKQQALKDFPHANIKHGINPFQLFP